jgi:hypothetical protein
MSSLKNAAMLMISTTTGSGLGSIYSHVIQPMSARKLIIRNNDYDSLRGLTVT